jgi:hypothetical protein
VSTDYDINSPEGMRSAVQWTQAFFALFKEGAVWAVPRSETLITVYPSKRSVIINPGHTPDPAIERVIREMGWQVQVIG